MAIRCRSRAAHFCALGATTFLTPIAFAAAASAQTSSEPAAMAQEDAGLGEIVVTATRRAESVQTVPIS
ncbi:hypothetical protein CVH10_17715, partial [Halomonas sp. ND22Bw]